MINLGWQGADRPAADPWPPAVLIVDDNAAKRLALGAILAPLGYTIVEAHSGEAALRCLVAQDFAVILLDVRMPGMDGFETAALIRLRERSEMTPIIFVTSHRVHEVWVEKHYEDGAADFLFAPVQPAELRAKVSFFVETFVKADALAEKAREVQTSADQLRVLTEAAPIGIFQTDGDNKFVYTNPQWTQITGLSAEAAIGHTWDSIVVPDQQSAILPDTHEGAGPRVAVSYRCSIEHPDSSVRIALIDAKPIVDKNGVTAGWVGTLSDVTPQARAETIAAEARCAMEKLNRELAEALRDRTAGMKLEQERTVLEARLAEARLIEERVKMEAQLHQAQRLETVGQLAGGIAHDFNNLLAGITSYASLVSFGLDEFASRSADEDGALTVLSQDVNEIIAGTKRAAELTRQLLIFSRREVVQPTVLDLNSIVADLEKLLGRTIGERIELCCAMAADAPRILADRGQVEQILMNLAVNARHAMDDQGQLRIETAQVELDAGDVVGRILAAGSYARLTVSDTGTGMTPEVIDRAFEPFFSTKPRGEGSGLGLATVYGIATQAGGEVTIKSEVGLGTIIEVLFPTSTEALTGSGDRQVGRAPIGRGETILLVEDEQTVREPARRILARHGYTVLCAASADEALDIISSASTTINLLLTDVVMPGRSGKELAADVVALVPGITVVYMSGHSGDALAHEGVLNDGLTLIEKPFTANVLLNTVHATLDGLRL